MQIYVCVKHVPDTAATISIEGETGYNDSSVKFIVNPYDEYALEEAIGLVEKNGGEVVVVTVGPQAAATTIRSALAMGAHRAILIKADAQFLDSSVTADALHAAIAADGKPPDLIFTGKGAVDSEGFQTAYRLAHKMDLPVVNEIVDLDIADGRTVAKREVGGGVRETVEMALPCVIGATKGLNEPRYPKLPDIMKAKKKEIKPMDLAELGCDASGAKTEVVKLIPAPERSAAQIMEGAMHDQVENLVRILKEEMCVL
jgi:electron transfer flavoprotein beta subunit